MGKIIKMQGGKALDATAREKMRRFLDKELTLAEVEGMTPSQARQIARIGCGLAASGRLHDARVIFEGLVAGNPKDTSSLAALGTIYVKLQRRADALECFDKALELYSRNVVALANRGELRLRAGDVGGVEDLARAVEVDEKGVSGAGRRARGLLSALARARPAARSERVAGLR